MPLLYVSSQSFLEDLSSSMPAIRPEATPINSESSIYSDRFASNGTSSPPPISAPRMALPSSCICINAFSRRSASGISTISGAIWRSSRFSEAPFILLSILSAIFNNRFLPVMEIHLPCNRWAMVNILPA